MIERACRITQVNRLEHLIAGTATVAGLRIRGDLLISPVGHRESLKRMGIPPDEKRNVGAFSAGAAAVPGVSP